MPRAMFLREKEKRRQKASRLCDAVIAAGHGDKTFSDLRALASEGNTLAQEYIAAVDAEYEAINEETARLRYHGSAHRIKRPSIY